MTGCKNYRSILERLSRFTVIPDHRQVRLESITGNHDWIPEVSLCSILE